MSIMRCKRRKIAAWEKLNPPTLLKVVGGRIANEILMYFRSQRKSAGDISLSDLLENGSEGGLSVMDVLASEEDLFEQAHIRSETRKLLGLLDQTLSSREKEIITLRYGLMGQKPLPQREVAAKLGISRSYVSRLETKALKKLRAAMEDDNTC